MTLEKGIEAEKRYSFNGWNIAMAMTQINPSVDEIFPKAEPLRPKEIYPSNLLPKYYIRL